MLHTRRGGVVPQLQLVMMSGDYVRRSVPVGLNPISIGRSPQNDFVINDDTVSWHHALVWLEGAAAWVKDLSSSNGTFQNHEIIHESSRLRMGDRLRMGEYVELVVQGDEPGFAPWRRSLSIVDVDTGAEHMVREDRFTIGAGDHNNLRLAVGPPLAATLLVHGTGELRLATDVSYDAIRPDQPFRIAGRELIIRELDPAQFGTAAFIADRYPYEVTVSRKGTSATFHDPASGRTKALQGSRAGLLRALAQGFHEHAPMIPEERGWMAHRDVATLLWQRLEGGAGDVDVLMYRLQRALAAAGFDPWCLETRTGAVRLRVAHAAVGAVGE